MLELKSQRQDDAVLTFEPQHRGLSLQYLFSHVTQLVDLLCIQEELAVLRGLPPTWVQELPQHYLWTKAEVTSKTWIIWTKAEVMWTKAWVMCTEAQARLEPCGTFCCCCRHPFECWQASRQMKKATSSKAAAHHRWVLKRCWCMMHSC